jgi:co-chaperonin GroES (HSP10)
MIVPLLHRILVKPDLLEEKDETYRRATASGIVIPNLDERSREQAAIDTGKVQPEITWFMQSMGVKP